MSWIICLTSPVALSRVAALLTAAAGSQRSVVQTCQAISELEIDVMYRLCTNDWWIHDDPSWNICLINIDKLSKTHQIYRIFGFQTMLAQPVSPAAYRRSFRQM